MELSTRHGVYWVSSVGRIGWVGVVVLTGWVNIVILEYEGTP